MGYINVLLVNSSKSIFQVTYEDIIYQHVFKYSAIPAIKILFNLNIQEQHNIIRNFAPIARNVKSPTIIRDEGENS